MIVFGSEQQGKQDQKGRDPQFASVAVVFSRHDGCQECVLVDGLITGLTATKTIIPSVLSYLNAETSTGQSWSNVDNHAGFAGLESKVGRG